MTTQRRSGQRGRGRILLAGEQLASYPPRPKNKCWWGSFRENRSSRLHQALVLLGIISVAAVIILLITNVPRGPMWWLGQKDTNVALVSRRFPKHGTNEFSQRCNWTRMNQQEQDQPDCTILVRPLPKGSEGIAQWLSMATSGYIVAKLAGCRLLMNYGDTVDIHQVLAPLSMNWTVPSGFQCSRTNRCKNASNFRSEHVVVGKRSVVVPSYRFAYINTPYEYLTMYQDLEELLPGFNMGTEMACSLGSLFELAPSASQFQPDIFTKILPALRDQKALVMAIYIRSGHTDKAAKTEIDGIVTEERTDMYKKNAMRCLECVLNLEEQYLSASEEAGLYFSRIVWMLVTDSESIKQWVVESYGSQDANKRISADKQKWKDQVVLREVLTTTSRGVQTRPARNPSTVDFAEALIDWYIIGESDLVVNNDYRRTYGATASLRTARPFYNPKNCSELPRFAPPRFQTAREASEAQEQRMSEAKKQEAKKLQ
mmetsp:Transcript_23436/g.38783  ORF Transcript_23436/g.38783 Transcript_23436/m.38783 type:complete len:486 (+) Transcript_23436:78-1535(+)